jgi:hypothetical protein
MQDFQECNDCISWGVSVVLLTILLLFTAMVLHNYHLMQVHVYGMRLSLNCGHQRAHCSSPNDIWVWRAMVEWSWQGKTLRKTWPSAILSTKIPHGLAWPRTQASAVRDHQLTTRATVQPSHDAHSMCGINSGNLCKISKVNSNICVSWNRSLYSPSFLEQLWLSYDYIPTDQNLVLAAMELHELNSGMRHTKGIQNKNCICISWNRLLKFTNF